MIKTILFDLGNVLFFFDHGKMINQVASCCGMKSDDLKKLLFQHQVQESFETGQINTGEFYKILQNHAAQAFTLHEWMEAASDIFTPNFDLWPIVENLKKEGIRLVLLSNTNEIHYNYLYSRYPILPLFDAKVLSFEVRASKPNPAIFQKALQQIQCPIEHCFYTDDIPEFIAGAKKAGIDSELFTSVEDLRAHLAKRDCQV